MLEAFLLVIIIVVVAYIAWHFVDQMKLPQPANMLARIGVGAAALYFLYQAVKDFLP